MRKRKFTVVPGGSSPIRIAAPVEESRRGGKILDVVDRILDKIRDEGIDSLTPEERRFSTSTRGAASRAMR